MKMLSSGTTQMYYQGKDLVCELSRSESRLLWGMGTPLALCKGKVSVFATDHARTVMLSMADVPSERRYSAYGYLERVGGICSFTGQRLDEVSGCYHLGQGHRMYSPRLMRFFSADTLSPFAVGGINTYAYCGGDPVNRDDPEGKMPFFTKRNSGVNSQTRKISNHQAQSIKRNLSLQNNALKHRRLSPPAIGQSEPPVNGAAGNSPESSIGMLRREVRSGDKRVSTFGEYQGNRRLSRISEVSEISEISGVSGVSPGGRSRSSLGSKGSIASRDFVGLEKLIGLQGVALIAAPVVSTTVLALVVYAAVQGIRGESVFNF
ncbi:RHS repeat-associated core domain-containing protein [Pseudomonas sp. Teo4]|uniref:RHS repeat-associated core domain-containing protein n=1 Tax=Pseudomonas sp. Teo4 TaxID=3064528 RepID=UPI002ABCC6FD|nr:RHS repeat-associated core domain-containing protein [Pseudomonas sp. Teo4]MDZ3991796.1 hypothetical protein [Pseudomonas sp. Teo4]